VTIKNTGNVRISSIALQGGSGNNCSRALIVPDETVDCFVWREVLETEFLEDTFNLAVTGLTGTTAGVVDLPAVAANTATVANPNKRVALLTVTVTATPTVVQKADDTVTQNHPGGL
jgi:hypothetical protein